MAEIVAEKKTEKRFSFKSKIKGFSNPGSKLVDDYEQVWSDELRRYIVVKKKDKRDLHSEIVESCSLTDMAILKRSALNGQIPTVLANYVAGVDMTKYPKDVHQLHAMSDIDSRFDSLSGNVKTAFNNDVSYFKKCIKDGTAKSVISDYFKKLQEKEASKIGGAE